MSARERWCRPYTGVTSSRAGTRRAGRGRRARSAGRAAGGIRRRGIWPATGDADDGQWNSALTAARATGAAGGPAGGGAQGPSGRVQHGLSLRPGCCAALRIACRRRPCGPPVTASLPGPCAPHGAVAGQAPPPRGRTRRPTTEPDHLEVPMMTTPIQITGNLTRDPELQARASGRFVARFDVAVNSRRRDPATQQWVDGETTFYPCTAWGEVAQNVAESLTRGARV